MNPLLLAVPLVLAAIARKYQQAPTRDADKPRPKPGSDKPDADGFGGSRGPKRPLSPPSKPHKPAGKAHGVNPDGTLKWDPKEHPAITLDTPAGPAEVLKPQKKPAARAKPKRAPRSFKSLDFSGAPKPAEKPASAPFKGLDFGGALKPKAKPAKPKPQARKALLAPKHTVDVVADQSNIQRSPVQAATDLYNYAHGAHPMWGVKNDPSPFVMSAQRDMGGVATDGIYGPKDRARGKTLIGKTFPPRK